MIYRELSRWIAQSESWQAFIDYDVPAEQRADYDFLERPEDFYISLLSQMQDALESFDHNESEENKSDLLSIAKGLEIYSLVGKRNNFAGVNYSRNMLYVAALYYLSDFPATAFLLLKQFSPRDFNTEIELFIYFFLSKNYVKKDAQENQYFNHILQFLRNGDFNEIEALQTAFSEILKREDYVESHLFVLTYVSRSLLNKFAANNLWYDLNESSPELDWKPYVRFNIGKSPQIWSFFPSQQAAIRNGLLTFERAFSLQTPTSSGKTSISELVIYNELLRRPDSKILYLAPFRALASELKNNLGKNLSTRLGIKIKTIYGGNAITEYDRLSIEQANVLISTPEKFMAIETGLSGTLNEFQTVICDEGHLIDDRSRGISYELLLSRLKKNDVVNRRFVFLSAIIPNIQVINEWLGGTESDIARSTYRPTEIELAFLNKQSAHRFDLEVNPQKDFPQKYILNHFLSISDFRSPETTITPTTYKAMTVSAALKSLNSGAVAIFAPTKDTRRGVAGLALEVIRQMQTSLPKPLNFCDRHAVDELVEYLTYVFGSDYLLVTSAKSGFLFHHGDLPQFVREIIEKYVRAEKIKFLICTNTLSEGVNLPIKTLVISTARRFESTRRPAVPIPLRDIKNLIGRAGRAGKETKGTIIVVNPADNDILLDVFANRNLEDVKGFLYDVVTIIEQYIIREKTNLSNELLDQLKESDYIDNSIIQLLAEDINVEELNDQINTLIENTLTYFQAGDTLKARLRQLFALRAEKVRPAIENGNIDIIRYTGISLRSFDSIEEIIDYSPEFLEHVNDPLDDTFLQYLFDILFEIDDFVEDIPNGYSREIVFNAVSAYINGAWYNEIAQLLNSSVDDAVIFLKFVDYRLQNTASSVIKYIETKRSSERASTSATVLNWTNYLTYGISTETEMNLIDLGIPDRILVINIAEWLRLGTFEYRGLEDLEAIIFRNSDTVIAFLKEQGIPAISIKLLEDYFSRNFQY